MTTQYTNSVAIVLPAGLANNASRTDEMYRRGPNTYSIRLSPTGNAPATHLGMVTFETDEYVAQVAAGVGGDVPPDAPYGEDDGSGGTWPTEQAAKAGYAAMTISVQAARQTSQGEHFQALLDGMQPSLQIIEEAV